MINIANISDIWDLFFPLSLLQCITGLLSQSKIDVMQHNYNASVLCLEQTLWAFTEMIDVWKQIYMQTNKHQTKPNQDTKGLFDLSAKPHKDILIPFPSMAFLNLYNPPKDRKCQPFCVCCFKCLFQATFSCVAECPSLALCTVHQPSERALPFFYLYVSFPLPPI